MTRTRVVLLLVVAAGAVAAVAVVFASGALGGGGNGASSDNEYPTSLATIERRDLASQTQVDATLGYADPAVIVAPAGTAPTAVAQADQAAASAQGQLDGARSTAAADAQALSQARSTLAADRAKAAVDCAAGDTSANGPCATDGQALTADQQAVTQAEGKVQADAQSVASATASLDGAEASLAAARSSATLYGQSSTYTDLPAVGSVVRRGQALYDVDGRPVVLLYGAVAPWRAFAPGMTPGRDVAELNANLRALGYGVSLGGSAYTEATGAAVAALQRALGDTPSGALPLGSVVFQPGAVRVTSVTPSLGATVQPGPVLNVTSTRRIVEIAFDASSQTSVAVGDPVTITMPDQSTTPGRVSYVGTVATTPSSDQGNGNGASSPTIEVDVVPTHPAETGRLDQAPVLVSITTASVSNVLVARVEALLALASGGYALEVVEPDGTHRLEAVDVGLFDDTDGLVQVTGPDVRAGQHVVVPGE
jgi:hypothetical protein